MKSKPFPITIDVEEQQVGHVLRQLDTMAGILTIHLRINKAQHDAKLLQKKSVTPEQYKAMVALEAKRPTDTRGPAALPKVQGQRKQRAPKSPHGSTKEIILKSLERGALHRNVIAQILVRSGLSAVSANAAIHSLYKEKLLVRVGPGTYRLAKTSHKKKGRWGKTINNKKGSRGDILKLLLQNPTEHITLIGRLVKIGYTKSALYNTISKLRQEGLIRRDGSAYSITERGRGALAPEPSADGMTEGHMLLEHQGVEHGEMT